MARMRKTNKEADWVVEELSELAYEVGWVGEK